MLLVAACLAVLTVIAAGMEALYSAHLAFFALPGALGHWHLDMELWVRLPWLAQTTPSLYPPWLPPILSLPGSLASTSRSAAAEGCH